MTTSTTSSHISSVIHFMLNDPHWFFLVFIQVLENAIFLKFKIIHNKRLATVLKQSIGGALI